MNLFLFIATMLLVVIYMYASISYLIVNVFSSLSGDALTTRNNTLKSILFFSLIAILVSAFCTGLLSNGDDIDSAISASSFLYIVIAIAMLIIILASFVFLILKSSKKTGSGVKYTSIRIVIKYSIIAEIVSVLFAWLLG